jgi:hypothetical protein
MFHEIKALADNQLKLGPKFLSPIEQLAEKRRIPHLQIKRRKKLWSSVKKKCTTPSTLKKSEKKERKLKLTN